MANKFDYLRMAKRVKELIARYGGPMTIETYTRTDNPTEPYKPQTTVTNTLEAIGVFTRYKKEEIDGSRVQIGDQKVLIDAQVALAPELDGKLLRGSEVWQVIKIEKLIPGDTALLYKVQVRA